MVANFRDKLEAFGVGSVVALVVGGGWMLAYGWSTRIMAVGAALLALGGVGVVVIIVYVAIKNFGPLHIPRRSEHETRNDS
jgi:hypothetical protein